MTGHPTAWGVMWMAAANLATFQQLYLIKPQSRIAEIGDAGLDDLAIFLGNRLG